LRRQVAAENLTAESWDSMTVVAGVVALLLLGYLLFALVHPERF
jgi:K+-transporting ATPase KdpF subunit